MRGCELDGEGHRRVSLTGYKEKRMIRLREKILRFMMGRNGVDEFSRALSFAVLFCLIVDLFARTGILSLLGIALMVYMYFRVFSRNVVKRQRENQKYRNLRYQAAVKRHQFKNQFRQRKNYKFFRCPTCRQKVRVPKGHGRVEISCPKCRERFLRRT